MSQACVKISQNRINDLLTHAALDTLITFLIILITFRTRRELRHGRGHFLRTFLLTLSVIVRGIVSTALALVFSSRESTRALLGYTGEALVIGSLGWALGIGIGCNTSTALAALITFALIRCGHNGFGAGND